MGLSLVAGVLYARLARSATKGGASLGGLAAGAICAFIGILVSYLLGDVPVSLLALGTVSSAVTGAIGGLLGALSLGRTAAASGRRAAARRVDVERCARAGAVARRRRHRASRRHERDAARLRVADRPLGGQRWRTWPAPCSR